MYIIRLFVDKFVKETGQKAFMSLGMKLLNSVFELAQASGKTISLRMECYFALLYGVSDSSQVRAFVCKDDLVNISSLLGSFQKTSDPDMQGMILSIDTRL